MATQTITQEVADKVAAAITRAGVTKTSIADKTGIPYSTLNRKLNAHVAFTVPEVYLVAVALGVHPSDLVPAVFGHAERLAS